MKRIRVLIVDDSIFMRKTLIKILGKEPELEIIGEANTGADGVRMAAELRPDVITMDVNMPGMDGIEATRRIMKDTPTPIVMLSTLTEEGSQTTMAALEAGAIDFIQKPTSGNILDLTGINNDLTRKMMMAAQASVAAIRPIAAAAPRSAVPVLQPFISSVTSLPGAPVPIIAIGSSTGGPRVLTSIFQNFPSNFPAAVVVAQHMPAEYTKSMAERLNEISSLTVKEAVHGDVLAAGTALITPGGYDLEVMKSRLIRLRPNEDKMAYIPSINLLFHSLAKHVARETIAVLLSGMGVDGAEGMKAIKEAGGYTLAQSERTCVVFGMPKAAIEMKCVDQVEDAEQMGAAIVKSLRAMLEIKA